MTFSMIRPAMAALTRAFVALVVVVLAGCSFEPEEKIWELSGAAFGTRYHINVVLTGDPGRLQHLSEGIEAVIESVDMAMSTWRDDSELSRFNQQDDQSDWFEVSEPLFRVLTASQTIAELSGGAFDITIGPVVNLWGFGPDGRPERVPDDETLSQALAATGYHQVELNPDLPGVRARSPQYLDLSGIAKGYGVDAVADYLAEQGIGAYLVEIGGEVRAHGRKPDGKVWRIAVEEPNDQGRSISRVVAMERYGLATSGDYRNYYESDGQRFSHTINPETGRPVDHRLASVTVIAETSMEADAWATAFSVLGFETSIALATRLNMAAYFIVRDEGAFRVEYTPAFATHLIQ